MLKVEMIPTGMLAENCYIVYAETTKNAFIIDPGDEGEKIARFIEQNKLTPKFIINTHGHFDHIGAVEYLKEKYQIPFYLHKADVELVKNHETLFGMPEEEVSVENIEMLLEGEEIFEFEEESIQVIATPGHTRGGICLYLAKSDVLFTGDTLFMGTIGRTDLKGGNYSELILSVNERLKEIPDTTVVYPGHGDKTTMGYERRYNQYFDL